MSSETVTNKKDTLGDKPRITIVDREPSIPSKAARQMRNAMITSELQKALDHLNKASRMAPKHDMEFLKMLHEQKRALGIEVAKLAGGPSISFDELVHS